MSSLCCCWRPKAAEDEAAAAAAAEMQEVEVARAGEDDSCDNSAEDEAATEPGRLPGVSDARPRQRRRGCTQLTKEQAGEEAWLVEPAPGDEGASRQEAEGLQNSNGLFGLSTEKVVEFYADLFMRINQFRATRARLQPLIISGYLCQHASDTWKQMSRQEDSGLPGVNGCCTTIYIPEEIYIHCLTYWDLPHHRRAGVPAAAFHYWSSNGDFIANGTKTPWDPELVETKLKLDSTALSYFKSSRNRYRRILLSKKCKYVGLYFKKSSIGIGTGATRYSVMALIS